MEESPKEQEKELFHTRQHRMIIVKSYAVMIILSAIIIFAAFGINSLFVIEPYWAFIGAGILVLFGFIAYSIPWFKTTFEITNQRVIIRKQGGLFQNDLLAVNLGKIKETAVEIKGTGSMFKFGKITINSDLELTHKHLEFENLPQVNEVKVYLDKLVNLVEENVPKEELPEFKPETPVIPSEVEGSQSENPEKPE